MMQIGFTESIYWKLLGAKKGVTEACCAWFQILLVYGKYFAAIKSSIQHQACLHINEGEILCKLRKNLCSDIVGKKSIFKWIQFFLQSFTYLWMCINGMCMKHDMKTLNWGSCVNIICIKCEANNISTKVSWL